MLEFPKEEQLRVLTFLVQPKQLHRKRFMDRPMSTEQMGPGAIVLGGAHGGLAIVKSLRRRGIRTLVMTANPDESGLRSKFVDRWEVCPDPSDEENFVDHLMSKSEAWRGAVIFPTGDSYLTAVSRNKDRISTAFRPAAESWDKVSQFVEKTLTYELAESVGVPHPTFAQPRDSAALESLIPTITFPAMIKPVVSHSFVEKFATKLFICETEQDLRRQFERCTQVSEPVFVCEIIPGGDYKTLNTIQLYLDASGQSIAEFACVKYRQIPPLYGVIRVGSSTPKQARLRDSALALLKAIDYRGYASVEFKDDPRDGTPKLIEVNARPLQMSQLAISAGVDFPLISYRDLTGIDQPKVENYLEDMVYIEVAADIASFFFLDADRNLARFFEPYRARNKTYPYFNLSDPGPFFADIKTRGLKLLRKVRAERPSKRGTNVE